MKILRLVVLGLSLVVLAGSVGAAVTPPAGGLELLGAGAVAPDFVMRDIHGREVRLSDFKGKVVILDFWATWCGPCIASMPHTQKLAAHYKDQGVVVVAAGTSDYLKQFKAWIPQNQSKYPDLQFCFDPNERDSATFDRRASAHLYHVAGIPTQFVIGRDGVITAAIVGNAGENDARTEAALARAGVKVDAAQVAEGEKQIRAAVEAEAARKLAAAEAEKNPPPPFFEDLGRLKSGLKAPDVEVLQLDGTTAKLADLMRDHVTVIGVWSGASGPGATYLADWKSWGEKYPQVKFIGVGGYASLEEVGQWRTDHAGKFAFTLVADPAGKAPQAAKDPVDMTAEERAAYKQASGEHFRNIFTCKLGGVMTPVPTTIVLDSAGRLVGWGAITGRRYGEALGNLLLRAGVPLSPGDVPTRIWTREETKEKPPEGKVGLLQIGVTAPDFSATDAAGQPVKLSDYRGKVVILDFWATWCGPCMASMPHTQEVSAHYKDQGVVVFANCTSDTRAKFEQWVKVNQEKYPDILWNHDPAERGPTRASRAKYGVEGIPCQFIIDREGKVVDIVVGYVKGEAILEAALAKAGIAVAPDLIEQAQKDKAKRDLMR